MKSSAGRPYAHTGLTRFLEKRILELRPRKSQIAIAAEAGFDAVNMLAMIKSGANRLPLDRVPALAKALDCDPAYLFRLAVDQQDGTLARIIDDIYGASVTRNEAAWLDALREASGNSDPTLTNKALRAVREIFGK